MAPGGPGNRGKKKETGKYRHSLRESGGFDHLGDGEQQAQNVLKVLLVPPWTTKRFLDCAKSAFDGMARVTNDQRTNGTAKHDGELVGEGLIKGAEFAA